MTQAAIHIKNITVKKPTGAIQSAANLIVFLILAFIMCEFHLWLIEGPWIRTKLRVCIPYAAYAVVSDSGPFAPHKTLYLPIAFDVFPALLCTNHLTHIHILP